VNGQASTVLWALGAFILPTCLHAQAYKIAFVSQRKNDRGIFVMQSDGSGLKQLTDDPLAVLTDGAWSPDGQRLTFNAMRKGGMRLGARGLAWNDNRDEEILSKYPLPFHFPLYIMDASGEGQKRLIDVPVAPGARWSPDGKRILFASAFEDPDRNDPRVRKGTKSVASALYVLDVASGQYKRITDVARSDLNAFATWSPDGSKVLFTCGRPPQQPREICTIDSDGGDEKQLTTRGGTAVGAQWSPDQQHIVFVAAPRGRSDEESGVYIMGADGTNQRRISRLLTTSVSWSPNSKSILIRASAAGYVLNVEENYGMKLALGGGRVLDEIFSPDGNEVIYRSNEEGKDQIYAIRVDGTGRRKLSDGVGADSMFAVSTSR